ncbi:epoxide hydrolase 1 [Trichoderma asperellum]|uniref:Epoxide hydrolase 1 n=1 Tax=Trichoderma asperellum TaxID=101201 RepID=A0A6V8QKQ8_TRIAP|nr:epoxide hydrolase 1 [Trichoderma asperellum]
MVHFSLAIPATLTEHSLNFVANFSNQPRPLIVKVHDSFLLETKAKAALTRITTQVEGMEFVDGVPANNVSDWARHWSTVYDWRKVEDELNSKFRHFTTTVQAGDNYTYPVPLHFIHHRSPRHDAIPLLFLHGWPGTFHEVGNIVDLLTNPPNTSLPAFHVVAPDLPGFGFSPAPTHAGLGLREMGQSFNSLMMQLNYSRYVGQGGDIGSHILRLMAADFPVSLVSMLSNLFSVSPNATDLERYAKHETSPDETAQISLLKNPDFSWTKAYWDIEASAPLQVSIGLTDSPVGWMAWQYMGMRMLSPGYDWGVDELITWSMLNYIQGPYGGIRSYKEAKREGVLDGNFPYVAQPVGVVQYFGDAAYYTPLEWTQRQGNISFYSRKAPHVVGGHFPAYINPRALAEDCWAFWGNESRSGSGIFLREALLAPAWFPQGSNVRDQ